MDSELILCRRTVVEPSRERGRWPLDRIFGAASVAGDRDLPRGRDFVGIFGERIACRNDVQGLRHISDVVDGRVYRLPTSLFRRGDGSGVLLDTLPTI